MKTNDQNHSSSPGVRGNPKIPSLRLLAGHLFMGILALFLWLPAASARTITLSLELARQQFSEVNPYYYGNTYYTVFVLVSSDTQPVTIDEVDSPGPGPVFSGTETGYGYSNFGDIGSVLNAITNGVWTLTVNQGDVSQQQYNFTVSVTGITNDFFPAVEIVTPYDGSTGVATNSALSWSGPANWDEVDAVDHNPDYSFYVSDSFSPPVTSWAGAPDLTLGTNQLEITYKTNAAAWVTISTPVNSLLEPFTNWVAGSVLDDFAQAQFVTSTNPMVSGGHTLFAHYTFDDATTTFDLGDDSSPANNSMGSYSYWGPIHTNTTNSVAGGSAVQFFGTSCMTAIDNVLTDYDNLLAGSFTFSAWVNTTASVGNDTDDAISGATVFWAYDDHNDTNDAIPLAITGSKAAFSVRDGFGDTTTVHSISSVNDGTYHLVTVSRDQTSGIMKMYVDGNFESEAAGPTVPLNGNNYFISIGGTTLSSYTGLVDDMQVYTGVLSPSEVDEIYTNPGVTVPDVAGQSGYGIVAHYDFEEGTPLAPDVSGNGNNLIFAGNFGGEGPVISTNAVAGDGSVSFDGESFLTAPTNLLGTLAGTFSLSLWVNTTQNYDYAGDEAYNGAGIISAYIPYGVTSDLIPVALTGGQVAFDTGNAEYDYDDTLTSEGSVNDGNWHHIVVIRNQSTGEKDIYIDGALDNSDFDTTDLLNAPQLLTIGAIADASNPDPTSPETSGYNGYQGLLDDVQIYARVLQTNEVAFLYAHPGLQIGAPVVVPNPYPVDVALQLNIIRAQDSNLGQYYLTYVSFDSVNPSPTTTNFVQSPNNYFNSAQYPGGGYSGSAILGSLDAVLNEFTNGLWSIDINQGSPTQQVYTFSVSITGLTTNLLAPVTEWTPTNWEVNVPTNPAYYWSGPTNFSSLMVDLLSGPAAGLPITATNWTTAPPLAYGTNRFDVSYTSNNFPGLTFTLPSSPPTNTVRTWTTTVTLTSQSFVDFVVGAPAPLPVTITNLVWTGKKVQFSFQTLAGRPHIVQSSTNLARGVWINLTNFTGDGSVRQFVFPTTNPPVQFFRVSTQ